MEKPENIYLNSIMIYANTKYYVSYKSIISHFIFSYLKILMELLEEMVQNKMKTIYEIVNRAL